MRFSSICLTLFLVVCSFQSQATRIKAVYSNGKLYWQNAYYLDPNKLVPTIWTPVIDLTPTKAWIPAGLKSAFPSIHLHASNDINNRIDFSNDELSLIGVEYHIGSTDQKIGAPSNEGGLPSNCGTTIALPLVGVIGNSLSCFLPNKLELTTTRQAPFSFIRPIFRIDEQAIINKIKQGADNKPLPEDNYLSGSQLFTSFYNFYYDPVDIPVPSLTRRYINTAFEFDLEVKSSARLDVVVKNGEQQQMDIMYFPDGRIEGNAYFEFEVSGYLPLGYKMTLTQTRKNRNTDFSLVKVGDPTQAIPYSLRWRSLYDASNNNIVLVDKGQLIKNTLLDKTCVLNNVTPLCDERYLDVDFKLSAEEAEAITTGMYESQFIAMFEPNM